jgi:hypothetical protein
MVGAFWWRVDAVLDEVALLDPTFLPTSDKARGAPGRRPRAVAAGGLRLELLSAAGDVAEQEAARSAGVWLAQETKAGAPSGVRSGWPRGWGGGATYDVRCATAS